MKEKDKKCNDNENAIKKAIALSAAISKKEIGITSEQAEKLLFLMADASKKVTFYSPVWVSLFYGDDMEQDSEPFYCYPLCEEYLDIINQAFQTYAKTKLDSGSLLGYLVCDDEVMDFYLQNQIVYIRTSFKVMDDSLCCVTEVGCKETLPCSALRSLEETLMQEFQGDWGQDFESVEISLPGLTLAYINGVPHFGKKEDIERRTGEKMKPLENAAICVRVYHDDFRGFDVVAD